MFSKFIEKKYNGHELNQTEYYEAIDKFLMSSVNSDAIKFFLSLSSFGMTRREVLYLTKALRDSGKVLEFDECIMEKHSTGGVGDSTSVVLVPLLASLGYRIIKTTAKSFLFTNGSADRFGSIPNFKVSLTTEELNNAFNKTNACILAHDDIMCPADRLLYEIREKCGIAEDLNLLAASIAAKKLASGAKVVLVDIKYGYSSIVKNREDATKVAKLLKYIFNHNNVESVIVLTNTMQTIGEGVGNAIEVVDGIKVLQGRKCMLRDVAVEYATEMILKADKKLKRKDVVDMIETSLDSGNAYKTFLEIVKVQGGDYDLVEGAKFFKPYNSVNFIAEKEGYVGCINSMMLGEIIRRLCAETHDGNIGIVQRTKIGDYVKKGDVVVTFYYKDKADLEKYKSAISGCIRVTKQKIEPVRVIEKVIR